MVAERDGPRTSIITRLAYLEKNMATSPAGVGAAYDEDLFIAAGERFRGSRAVVNAGVLKAIHTRDVEFTPLDAVGKENRVTGDFGPVVEFDKAIGTLRAQRSGEHRRENLDAKPSGLSDRAASEIGAGKA